MQYTRYTDEILMQNKALERRNEEMIKLVEAWVSNSRKSKPKFTRSLDMYEIENLLIRLYQMYKTPASLFDEHGKLLFSIGWKNSCLRLMGNQLKNLKCCGELLVEQPVHVGESTFFNYQIRNFIHITEVPIIVQKELVGTLLINQFLIEDALPSQAQIEEMAFESGIEPVVFRKAVEELPVLGRNEVEKATEFYTLVSEMISFIASRNLELQNQQAAFDQKSEISFILKEKLNEQAYIINSVYQCIVQQHQEIEMLRNELSLLRKKPVLEQKEKNLVEVQPGL